MKRSFFLRVLGFCALLLVFVPFARAYSPNPDLTANGAIATLKTDVNASPLYGESYNLGPTGLRGWIYIDRNNMGNDGLQTAQSRQILVTIASTPGSAVLAVDDVILGAMAGSAGVVPLFTSDCRKAFGAAIGDAEKTGAGTLRVKRWRAGTTSDVNIAMTVMGDYTATAPYSCPKSAQILANARTYFVGQLLANSSFLSKDLGGAVDGLALLAGVAPGDANYGTVQTRLQSYARSLVPSSTLVGCDTWNWAYINIFLSEYYLRTVADGAPDAQVLPGISAYTVALAKGQSKYGTYGHGGAEQHADGSLHGSISWYGPVNSAGIPANIAIVLGKIALQAGFQAIDPEIDPAITRGSNFFGWYVNKGSIPYGEHEPYSNGHASNGKDPMCAVLFGLQANRPLETEYFTRISTAGCTGREYGHTGQGFSYLWGAMGANMGGPAAAAAYLNNVRWHLDLERRTDGSFVYDGGEQYGAGTTSGGTYLGASQSYGGMNATAWYILSYALPLQRLYITGRNANPANTLDAAKVAKAIAAATYKLDCKDTVNYPVSRLMTDLGEWDPAVRAYAAAELATRTLTATDENNLITMAEGADANARQGACEVLGIRKTTAALPALGRRLSDSDYWVRGKAANALRQFGSAASPQLTPMLTAFAANATDPNVIVWTDPIQISNGYLADTLFQAMAANTAAADKNLLYPAVTVGLKQPDGMARMYLGDFIKNRLTYADVQAVAPSIVDAVAERSPADRMFSDVIRYAGLQTLAKYKIEEGIPLALMVKEQTWHGDDWDPFDLLTNTYRGAARDALPTLYKWQAHIPQFAADYSIGGCCPARLQNITDKIASTIAAIENDTNPPTLNFFKTLSASAAPAAITLPTNSVVLTATLADLDAGVPNFVWTKVSGAGAVTFNPSGPTASATSTAIFDTPGTYVLRVQAVDRSILDYVIWITYSLGYFDFQTYNEILGAVSTTVTVTVGADANRAPVAQNQTLTTPLNTAKSVTLAATDPNGDAMTYSVVTAPAHGALSGTAPALLYTPTTGYTGADSFTFKANDGRADSAAGTVTIDVGTVGNRRPVAVSQSVTTPEETVRGIVIAGTDPDSDPLTYQIVSGPQHGTLSGTAPNLTYTSAPNYPASNNNGSDSITFTVSDGALTSAPATVSIIVTPINDAPQATAQSVNVSVNSVNAITLTASDPEGYGLLYSVLSNPTHGTLAGTAPNLTYTPASNYHGPDNFTFKVTDSEGVVSSAAVSITIINDPPVANAQSLELAPNIGQAITLTGSDNCNDPLTYVVVTQPANGVLSGTAPNLTYTPNVNFSGTDSFTFKVNDGTNDSPVATVVLNVVQWQTWTNIAPGNWSTGANWTGAAAPAAGGGSNALLAFNTTPYAAASVNDLAGTFQLNRWNFGTALPALTFSGNALSFVTNGATLPQVNQSSANGVTVSNSLALAVNTALGGSGSGALTLSGVISGAGGLVKTSSGTLTVSAANGYAGGTTVTAGTLNPHGNGTGSTRAFFGTGSVTMAGGTTLKPTDQSGQPVDMNHPFVLSDGVVSVPVPFGGGTDLRLRGVISGPGGLAVSGGTRWLALYGANTFSGGVSVGDGNLVQINTASALGTGTFSLGNSAGGSLVSLTSLTGVQVTNAIDLKFGGVLTVNTGSGGLNLSGAIQNTGGLTKTGGNTLTLAGTNTYTGSTTISGGTLAFSSAASLAQGSLVIASGAKAALNYTGTRRISALTLNGVAQPNGIYSVANAATYFSGTGTVTVAPATTTALALTGGATPSSQGSPLTFTATVAGTTPTGNVSFYAGASLIGTSALNGSFQASVTTSSLAVGTYNITAQYAGNTNNGASTSPAVVVQVAGAVPVPAAPTNLAAVAGNHLTGLTWTAASGATSYIVKRSLTSGGPYVAVGFTSLTSFGDTPLVNGTPYYYVVSATNGAGESANSTQVGATPVNQTPVAGAQNVVTAQNMALAITLAATDADGDPLTYAIVASPLHGTLSGPVPNVTYTPAANYSGSDSFTFKVNDGTIDSPAATVSVNVVGLTTWTNIAPGNWSSGVNWTGSVAPPAGGATYGLLSFNTSPYATASVNDLAGTFQLNRVNFGSALPTMTVSGNALSFETNVNAPPQINQNGANAITVSNNIALAANTTVGGTGVGALSLSGVITGIGSLTQANTGILTIGGSGTNTFSGGAIVNVGTLVLNLSRLNLGAGAVTLAGGTTFYTTNFEGNTSGGAIGNTFNLGSGTVTMRTVKDIWITGPVTGSGILQIQGSGRTPGVMLSGAKTFSGGVKLSPTNGGTPTVTIDDNGSLGTGPLRTELTAASVSAGNLRTVANLTAAPGVANTVDLAPGCRLVVDTGSFGLLLSGPVINTGNLIKIGTGTLTLSGANTYTGTTTVSAGTLAFSSTASVGQGALLLTSGAKAALNFSGTRQVASLSLGGTAQANGSYGSTASSAIFKNDTYFSGTGTVTVGPLPAATTTTLALTGGVTPSPLGSALTFRATVTGSAPTGNVSFYDGVTLIGTGTLNGSFQASVTTSSLTVGSHNITAQYAGNVTNAASTSAVMVIPVVESIAQWRPAHFTAGEITAGLAADGVDPDGDGVSNVNEYLLGTDPRSADQPLLTITRNGGNCVLSFVARTATGGGYAGLTRKYDLIYTTDLKTPASWGGVGGYTGIVGAGQSVSATLPIAAPDKSYRLKVWLE
ncbi:MAG: DUF6288 domain-containing protein [Chthoniobacter sp.]|nr:DUF6288 domain-containing protein [Chthoniobacter sp.]